MSKLPEYEHDIEKDGQVLVDLEDDDGKKIGTAHIGVGDPRNPHSNLTASDEKRLDPQGDPVVEGLPWSEAGTGLYLLVALSPTPTWPTAGNNYNGCSHGLSRLPGAGEARLLVGTSLGKPAFATPVIGACLELPVDLGTDSVKRRYVAEWIAHTAVEALQKSGLGFDLNHKELGGLYKKLAMDISVSANDAINAAGL